MSKFLKALIVTPCLIVAVSVLAAIFFPKECLAIVTNKEAIKATKERAAINVLLVATNYVVE